ncbi:MAG TPA: hypothetical protein VNO30_25985 [Kofleriaceae bacterium]|nr:hypothetical protein [Kofleriaceae bacterium]
MSNAMPDSAPRKPGEASPIAQLATLVGIAVLVLNAAFFFLSDAYFDDRVKRFGVKELERLSGARLDFAIFTIVVGAGAILAGRYPRAFAHSAAAGAGLLALVAAPFAMRYGVLGVALLIVAGAFGFLTRLSLRRSRAAWACLAAMCAVSSVVLLFGAPKIRHLVGIGMWIAMIAPGLLAAATVALSQIRDDYREAA